MQSKDGGANFFAALEFLSKLHFPREQIKRVIGNLLSLYEGQWGLIQENGYQLVVECCLEEQIGQARNVSRDAVKGKHDASTSREIPKKGSRAGLGRPDDKRKKVNGDKMLQKMGSARRTCSTSKEKELIVPRPKKARVTTQVSNDLDVSRASLVKLGKQNESDNRRSRIYKRFAMQKFSQSQVDFSYASAHASSSVEKEAPPDLVLQTEDHCEVSTSLLSEGPSTISTSPISTSPIDKTSLFPRAFGTSPEGFTGPTSSSFFHPPSFNFPPSCAVSSTSRTKEGNIQRNSMLAP